MWNTEPIERVSSVTSSIAAVTLGAMPPLIVAILGVATKEWAPALGGLACAAVAAPIVAGGFAVVNRSSVRGGSGPVLDEIAARIGGTVTGATLLWSRVRPRVVGVTNGRAWRLTFRRQGGVLGPWRPGERRLWLRWSYELAVKVPVLARIGFSPGTTGSAVARVFGLDTPIVVGEGLVAYAGRTPEGRALVTRPAAVGPALRLASFGPLGTLVRIGGGQLDLGGYLADGVTAEQLASLLTDALELGSALEP